MGFAVAFEVVPLDSASPTFTLADACSINNVAELELRDVPCVADLDFAKFVNANFPDFFRGHTGWFDMSSHGLAQVLTRTICHLDCVVAVGFDRLDLSHSHRASLDQRHRNSGAVLANDLGHTNFGTEKCFHCPLAPI